MIIIMINNSLIMIVVKYKDLKQVPVNVTNVFKALNYISQTINWHLVLLIK